MSIECSCVVLTPDVEERIKRAKSIILESRLTVGMQPIDSLRINLSDDACLQIGGYNNNGTSCNLDDKKHGTLSNEEQYINLLRKLLSAPLRQNRTGVKTHGLFAEKLEFSLTNRAGDHVVPLLTTKRVPARLVIAELLWFLSGKCTDTSKLLEENCHIWDDNTTREFLDSRGLTEYEVGECGPIYGYQWRSWNRAYRSEDTINDTSYDQIEKVINTLRTDPTDRRMIVSAWNPEQLDQMVLPPCHWSFQFHCECNDKCIDNDNNDNDNNDKCSDSGDKHSGSYSLNCLLNMRSADVALGVPFNIASYALLTHMVAKCVNMKPGRLVIMMADCHLYENHTDGVREQIQRSVREFPILSFRDDIVSGGDIDQFNSIDQFIISGYEPHGVIKYKMAI